MLFNKTIEEIAVEMMKEQKRIPYFGRHANFEVGESHVWILSRSRDSGIVEISNYENILKHLVTLYPDDVFNERCGHWAVGWVEYICVKVFDDKATITDAFKKSIDILKGLEDYPVYDDEDVSMREMEAINEYIRDYLSCRLNSLNLDYDIETSEEEMVNIIDWIYTEKNPFVDLDGSVGFDEVTDDEILTLLGRSVTNE
jgi:hypothetical protein